MSPQGGAAGGGKEEPERVDADRHPPHGHLALQQSVHSFLLR